MLKAAHMRHHQTRPGTGMRAAAITSAARALRLAYEHLAFYGLVALFGISCLAWSLPAALLRPLLPERVGGPIGRFMIMAGFRYFLGAMRLCGIMRCDLGELDRLRAAGPLVICPNHPSLMDALLVISRLPGIVCIMKAEVWDNAFLGGGARLAGYIRNDAPVRLIKSATQAVRAGQQLLIFPEGTRTDRRSGAAIGGFRGGFALIAKVAGAPVQTVFLESNTAFLGKGWPFFRKPDFPLVYRARLGRRFEVGGDVQAFVRELEAYCRAELAAAPPPDER